ncbi:SDR family NAD(P)-dependent oxidoreductase [candidate division KSB1 bacterium]|nr:SDR family NAD(P)-dependent oxidoreductase [candidate division KSB1 bacterium]
MQTILITGANRGLGLEFVQQLLKQETRLFACCREPEKADTLSKLSKSTPDRLELVTCDVASKESIIQAVREVKSKTNQIDLLINNAGILINDETLDSLQAETLVQNFWVHAIGPTLLIRECLPLLKASPKAKILNLSSQLGSLNNKMSGGNYSYSSSKAALNMLTRCMAIDLRHEGVIAVVVHPGWVKTSMGGPHAAITPTESVTGMLKLVQGLNEADTGKFFTWTGERHPW